jgi:hypothetical protein
MTSRPAAIPPGPAAAAWTARAIRRQTLFAAQRPQVLAQRGQELLFAHRRQDRGID